MDVKKLKEMTEELSCEIRGHSDAAYLIVEAAQGQIDGFAKLGCIHDAANGKLMEYLNSLFFLLTAINRTADKIDASVSSLIADTE